MREVFRGFDIIAASRTHITTWWWSTTTKMSSYRIRKGKVEDCSAVVRLATTLRESFSHAEFVIPLSEERLREDGFGEKQLFRFFVAEYHSLDSSQSEKEIVGLASFNDTYSLFSGRYAYLHALVVDEHHRGKGLGMALMKAVVNDCLSLGCTKLSWFVDSSNHRLEKFYKSIESENLTQLTGFEGWRLMEAKMQKFNQEFKTVNSSNCIIKFDENS